MAAVQLNQTNQNKGDVNNRLKPNRVAELAATLFVNLYMHERGTKIPSNIAEAAVNAAREFYKVVDQSEG